MSSAPGVSCIVKNGDMRRAKMQNRDLGGVENLQRALRRDQAIPLFENIFDNGPPARVVESNADPPARTHIGGHEADLGVALDEVFLLVEGRLDPDGYARVAVVVVVKAGEGLFATPERRRAM